MSLLKLRLKKKYTPVVDVSNIAAIVIKQASSKRLPCIVELWLVRLGNVLAASEVLVFFIISKLFNLSKAI
jgi:hypothetical protein